MPRSAAKVVLRFSVVTWSFCTFIGWFIPARPQGEKKVFVYTYNIISDLSSPAANAVIVVHINSLHDARLAYVVVHLFQVDLKTGLAIEEACYAQVCLHNEHLHLCENQTSFGI